MNIEQLNQKHGHLLTERFVFKSIQNCDITQETEILILKTGSPLCSGMHLKWRDAVCRKQCRTSK